MLVWRIVFCVETAIFEYSSPNIQLPSLPSKKKWVEPTPPLASERAD
jgi:hypothetical protein